MRFLLVDRIESFEPATSIQGTKCAAMAEDYFEWHFPEQPIVPGMLILEAFVQLAGWLEAASSDFERWFLLEQVHSARYYDFAVPGDVIALALTCEQRDEKRCRYRAESSVAGKRGATLEFEGRLVPLGDLESRAASRRHFAILRRERS
jgi:3-hydroxyacyl-[acyl-carrier-protein] dehydratase